MNAMLTLYVVVAALAAGWATADTPVHQETCAEKPLATVDELVVENCNAPPCLLVRGTNAHMNVTFTPSKDIRELTARAFGKVAEMNVPYRVPQKNACENSGLTCPLEAGKAVTYLATLPVETWYPLITVPVKWELLDQDGNVVICTEILAKIVKANHKKDH